MAAPGVGTEPANQPHIVFILLDDAGWAEVGYNDPRVPTPIMDRLARQGVKLGNYYVQPLCTPSRTQLLTGRHEVRHMINHPRPSSISKYVIYSFMQTNQHRFALYD